jgi:hypothetical protein
MGSIQHPATLALRRLGTSLSGFCRSHGLDRLDLYAAIRSERWAIVKVRRALGDRTCDALGLPRVTTPDGVATSPASEAERGAAGSARRAPETRVSGRRATPRDRVAERQSSRGQSSGAEPRIADHRENELADASRQRVPNPSQVRDGA